MPYRLTRRPGLNAGIKNRTISLPATEVRSGPKLPVSSLLYSFKSRDDVINTASGTTLTVSTRFSQFDYVQVFCAWGSTSGTPTISDGVNTYTQVGSTIVDVSDTQSFAIFECLSAVAGPVTITFTPPGGAQPWRAVGASMWGGLTGSAQTPVSNIQATPAQTADAVTSTNITPSVQLPAALIGYCFGVGSSQTLSPGTGFSTHGKFNSFNVAFFPDALAEDTLITTSSPVSATFNAAVASRTVSVATVVTQAGATQALSWNLFDDSSDTFYTATLASSNTLTASLFDDSSDSFFAADVAITGGGVTLTPSLYTDSDTFFAPTLASSNSLTSSLYTDTDTFFAATLSGGGSTTLTPSLYTDADTFFAATLASSNLLTSSLYTDTDTFFAPTLVSSNLLTPSLYTDSDTIFSAVVTKSNSLTPGLYTDGDTFFAATVSVAGVTVSPSLYTEGDTFFAPTVSSGASTLTPSLYTDGDTFFTHSAGIVGDSEITVTWTPSDDPSVTGYYVYWDTVSRAGGVYSDYAHSADVAGISSAFKVIGGLTTGVTYYINISSHSTGGHDIFESDLFGEVSLVAHTKSVFPPAFVNGPTFFAATIVPGSVTLTAGLFTDADTFPATVVAFDTTGEIEVTWTKSVDPSVTGYYVYWDTVSHSAGTYADYPNSHDVTGINSELYKITGLIAGATYYVNISSHGSGGHDTLESELFGEVSVQAHSNALSQLARVNNSAVFYDSSISTTYAATADLVDLGNVLYSAVVTPGGNSLTANLFVNSSTVFDARVDSGVWSVTPPLFTNASIVYNAGISNGVLPDLFVASNTVFSAAVLAGAINAAPNLVTNQSTVFTPSVSTVLVTQNYVDPDSIYSPIVANHNQLAPSEFLSTNAFFNATATIGNNQLGAQLLVNSPEFYPLVVFAGQVTISSALFTDSDGFFTTTISTKSDVVPSLVLNDNTFFVNVASVDSPLVLLQRVLGQNEIYPPIVDIDKFLATQLYSDVDSFYTPTILLGDIIGQVTNPAVLVKNVSYSVSILR